MRSQERQGYARNRQPPHILTPTNGLHTTIDSLQVACSSGDVFESNPRPQTANIAAATLKALKRRGLLWTRRRAEWRVKLKRETRCFHWSPAHRRLLEHLAGKYLRQSEQQTRLPHEFLHHRR